MDFITAHPILAAAVVFGTLLLLLATYTTLSVLTMMLIMNIVGITSSFTGGFDIAAGTFVAFHALLFMRRKLRKKDKKAAVVRMTTQATAATNPYLGAVASLPALRK
jgi:hypothetical protein